MNMSRSAAAAVVASSGIAMEGLESRRLLAATTLRVDVGGNGFTESSGKVWQADRGFTGGTVSTTGGAVAGTTSDGLYNSRRFGDFAYSLPIQSGDYRVRLLMMDPTHATAGQRAFDVFSEKVLALNDFDVAGAGGGDAAVTKTFVTKVRDGRLNLWFDSVKDQAIVSAIEVTPYVAPGIQWKEVAPAPLPKFEHMGEAVNGKLYVMGGYRTADTKATGQVAVYDPATNKWTTKKDMPEVLNHAGTVTDFQYIYLAGGYVGDWQGVSSPLTRHVWRYDTTNDTWQAMLSLPAARSAGALVRAGRMLHFFGGLDSRKRDMGDHWILDLRRPTKWISAPALPNPRNHLGFAEVGGKIYAVGGQHNLNEDTGNDAAVHAYDLVSGTWSAVASLPRPTSHTHNSTFAMGGKLITAGGSTAGIHSLTQVMEYDPATNKWRQLGELPVALSATSADLLNGHIVISGGTTEGSQPQNDTWINV